MFAFDVLGKFFTEILLSSLEGDGEGEDDEKVDLRTKRSKKATHTPIISSFRFREYWVLGLIFKKRKDEKTEFQERIKMVDDFQCRPQNYRKSERGWRNLSVEVKQIDS